MKNWLHVSNFGSIGLNIGEGVSRGLSLEDSEFTGGFDVTP